MLNGKYCGNCQHWKNARPTMKGLLPYFGTCEKGRPLKQGQKYNHTVRIGENRITYKAKYCDFKLRCDRGCNEWEENDER